MASKKSTKQRAGVGAVLRVYVSYVKKYPVLLTLVILGGVLLQAATLAVPLYLKQFFNVLTQGAPASVAISTLFVLLGIIAFIEIIEIASRRIQGWSAANLEAHVMSDLFDESFRYLIDHSYNFFTSNFAGSLTHKVTKFSRSFEALFENIVINFFATFLFVSGAVGVLFVRNHLLGIALGVWCVVFLWFQIYVARLRQPTREARAEADTKITATLADAISNQNTISLFSGSRFERGIFGAVVGDWQKKTLWSWLVDDWIWGGIGLFMLVIEIGLLCGAVFYWKQGLLTIGDFVLIQAYLMTTFDRLVGINRDLRRFYDAFADAGEMVHILQTPHDIQDVPDATKLTVTQGEVSFNKVEFTFGASTSVLTDLDLHMSAHQKVALVGPSGAGKSTITKLLLRLFDVKKGNITIDGQDIAKVTQDSLREAISFVPQEPVLFHRTLMENIRYGRRTATDAEVIEAAKKAHCHEFISQLPETYNTYVGERGVKLSGGERQRVAIARAILKNSPILVLDEATSSLDSESESLIQDALRVLMEGKTVIVIAHRLSTIMKMDRIIVLEGGKVVANGTHDELLAQGGLYQKLWSIQAGGFIVDEDAEKDEVDEESLEDEI